MKQDQPTGILNGVGGWIKTNALPLFTGVVGVIVAYTLLSDKVNDLEGDQGDFQSVFAAEAEELRDDIDAGDDTDTKILLRLGSIEQKLDLLLDGKIVLD